MLIRKRHHKARSKTPAQRVVCPLGPAAREKGGKDEAGLVHSLFEDPVFAICFKRQESSASLTLSYVAFGKKSIEL